MNWLLIIITLLAVMFFLFIYAMVRLSHFRRKLSALEKTVAELRDKTNR